MLPGTGGLTRLTDKRRVRRDLADVFCTTIEGVRADRALAWGLVDAVATPKKFADTLLRRAHELTSARRSVGGTAATTGIALTPLERQVDETGLHYPNLDVAIDRGTRVATFTLRGPEAAGPDMPADIVALGAKWWPLAAARELDDAILLLRTNELAIGTWVMRTVGDPDVVRAVDRVLDTHSQHWLVRETIGMWRRTLSRLDLSSRTVFALIDRGSCFVGTLLELALAADRSYMLAFPDAPAEEPRIACHRRISAPIRCATAAPGWRTDFRSMCRRRKLRNRGIRSYARQEHAMRAWSPIRRTISIGTDEIRLAIEERASLSPDALTGMEASLRFTGPETMQTRIFGRLSAWQNWIFQRPNAVGKEGALKVFGSGSRAKFDWERV